MEVYGLSLSISFIVLIFKMVSVLSRQIQMFVALLWMVLKKRFSRRKIAKKQVKLINDYHKLMVGWERRLDDMEGVSVQRVGKEK
jgi:hypothetical protein